jgi:hypothetical protein
VAVLDTFYILFKSNSKDAEKGFESVNKSIVRMDQSLNKFAKKWLSLYAIFAGLTNAVSYAFNLTQASQALAVNIEELDAWGSALKKTGGNAESFAKVLESLSAHLGTNPKTALQLLPKIADQFAKLNRIQALQYGKMLGLDTPTILLLQQGRREVEALIARQKELGVVTTRDAAIFKKFQSDTQDLGKGFQSLTRDYLLMIIPAIDKVLEKLTKFIVYIRKHSGLVKGALVPIAAVFAGIAGSIILANIPLFIFIGAVALLASAFALAYDDIETFRKGGESVVGDMLKRWPELKDVVQGVFDAIQIGAKGVVWFLCQMLYKINTIIEAAKIVYNYASPYIDKFTDALKIEGQDVDFFGKLSNAKKTINQANTTPLNSVLGSQLWNPNLQGNKEINLTIGEIQISTMATDATDISNAIGGELQRQMRQLQNNYAGGQLI